MDPLGITTSAPKEIGGTKRRANENVTRKYFNFGKDTIQITPIYNNFFFIMPFFFQLKFMVFLLKVFVYCLKFHSRNSIKPSQF